MLKMNALPKLPQFDCETEGRKKKIMEMNDEKYNKSMRLHINFIMICQ
jgi:hypothetical protein